MADGPIIRTTTHGYVVENFIGPCVHTGNMYSVITRGGVPAIFPDEESIPPKWRKHARAATMLEVARGYLMDRVVHVVNQYDDAGKLVSRNAAPDPYKRMD